MKNDSKAISQVRKLIHIAGVALVMTVSLGLVVAVSGHPTENLPISNLTVSSVASIHSVPQSAVPAPVLAATDNVQAELMHDAPIVELKSTVELKPAVEVKAAVVAHGHKVRMLVTAYCPCTKCCGENASGITASGKLVSYNAGRFVAADSSLPFGTKIMIPGYSPANVEVLDRGGAIRGNHIDVFFPTHEQALKWGRQMIEVTVLD